MYSNTLFIRVLCYFSVALFGTSIIALIAKAALKFWWLIPVGIIHCIVTYIAGFRVMRISSFTETAIDIRWPTRRQLAYDSVTQIINLSPYAYCYYALVMITKEGLILGRFNICYVPTDQGIIEHLKTHGVKVRNLWFWQEK